PAVETARVLLARDLIRSRRALGWSQAELARRAGVRLETLDRLERATHSPSIATVEKLERALEGDQALKQAGTAAKKRR
ncbi:MAG: helix-turn-helix domain-containing protein, partial [Pirellulales bacterium]